MGKTHEEERDVHNPPDFHSDSFSREPLLYLPPLLSSLPERLSHQKLEHTPGSSALTTETRLPDIDPASLSLHKALHHFKPLTSEYASTPYAEAFNWDELVLPELDLEREWYCVVFRSRRKEGSLNGPLYEADKLAHEEAVKNGGLIAYWYGVPHPITKLNMATCIWQSRAHAIAANSRPHHITAMKLTAQSYEVYNLERYVLSKEKGSTGVEVRDFRGGDVGW